MVQVVLSLEKKSDERLRRLANELYAGKKGAMSEIVEQSLELFEENVKRDAAYEKLLAKVKDAKTLGIGKFDREECYAR